MIELRDFLDGAIDLAEESCSICHRLDSGIRCVSLALDNQTFELMCDRCWRQILAWASRLLDPASSPPEACP